MASQVPQIKASATLFSFLAFRHRSEKHLRPVEKTHYKSLWWIFVLVGLSAVSRGGRLCGQI